MEEKFCGKNRNGKWVCRLCNGEDHTFRDEGNFKIHINGGTHKKNCGMEIKTKSVLKDEEINSLKGEIESLKKQLDEVSKLLIESRAEVKYLKTEKKTPPVIQLKEQQVIPQVTQLVIPKNEVVKVSKEEKERKPRKKMSIEKFYEWIEKEYPPGDRLSFCNFIGIDDTAEIYNDDNYPIYFTMTNPKTIKPELDKIINNIEGSIYWVPDLDTFFMIAGRKFWTHMIDPEQDIIMYFKLIIHNLVQNHRETFPDNSYSPEYNTTILLNKLTETLKTKCIIPS